MATIQQYRNTVADYLREGYGATDLKLRGGGSHPRYEFMLPDKTATFSVLLNDRNGAGGSNAADMKLQDIRRLLGPPPWPNRSCAEKRTLNEMTEQVAAEAAALRPTDHDPIPDDVPDAGRAAVVLPSWKCAVSLRSKSNKSLDFFLPSEAVAAFHEGNSGPRGTTIGFTAPRLWTVRHSDDDHHALGDRGVLVVGGKPYLSRWAPFLRMPATVTLIGGRLEIRLDEEPRGAGAIPDAAGAAPPVGREETPVETEVETEKVSVPIPDLPTTYGPSRVLADQVEVLRTIRRLESLTSYRLVKVRADDGSHSWEWRAPPIRLEP